MTPIDSPQQVHGTRKGKVRAVHAAPARLVLPELGPDPVRPNVSELSPAPREAIVPAPRPTVRPVERPLASDLGVPAVLQHQVVAVEVGSSAGPVAVHNWIEGQVGTLLLTPTQARVWARAGRLTLVTAEGDVLPFTVLAPKESRTAALGAHWPLGEPASLALRIALAAARDVGNLLTFPVWLVRAAHVSGARNNQLARLLNRIRAASPTTAVHYGHAFGHPHASPSQHRPYCHKGLHGREGWPVEL